MSDVHEGIPEGRVLLLVRLAPEITTKSRRTRRRFRDRLVHNLHDALEADGIGHRVRALWSRILVEADDPSALSRIASVFGVASVSRVDARIAADLDAIVRTGEELYREDVRGHSYAVRARRSGAHPFSSRDVKVQLGAALNPYGRVDLDDPEVTVSVEVRDDEAFLFRDRSEGPGGLPLGVEGTAICLISGGFDSAVAAWLMLKRGVSLEYVFCNLGGEAYERAVVSVAKILADDWSHGDRPRIHVVEFEAVVDALKEAVTPRYWQVVLKRLMYRVGERIAEEVGAEALITGEAVGQVSSQTLGNLRAIDEVARLPVLRPLVAMDKIEIIDRAEHVGTSALSARIREYCAILPDRPVTHSSPDAARREEERIDPSVLDAPVRERKVLDLRSLRPEDLVAPYLFVDEIPEGAVVLDCRPLDRYRAWHYPGAQRRDLDDLAARIKELEKERQYVLYCDFGVQTAHLAELMQRVGYEAYSFRGGLRGIMRHSQEAGRTPETVS